MHELSTYVEEPVGILPHLYYRNGNKFDPSCYGSPFAHGFRGYIYPHNVEPIALKLYTYECPVGSRMKLDMFNKFRDLGIPNIVRLYDCLFCSPDSLGQVEGYTMELITGRKTLIFDLSFKDFMCITAKLEETLVALSEEKIIIRDMNRSNILFFDNEPFVIDLDSFFTSVHSKRYIYAKNRKTILKCLNDILKWQSINKNGKLYSPILTNFPFSSIPDCVEKSLGGSSPEEFVNNKILTYK